MTQTSPLFEIVYLASYTDMLPNEVWPDRLADDITLLKGDDQCDATEYCRRLQLVPASTVDGRVANSRELDLGRIVEMVRWRYPNGTNLRLAEVADAAGVAKDARGVAAALEHKTKNDDRLKDLREGKGTLGGTTFVFASVVDNVQCQFAEAFFQRRFTTPRRSLRIVDQQIPAGVTLWRDGDKTCVLLLADPKAIAQLQQIHSAILAGDLDHIEACWHLIDHTTLKYHQVVNPASIGCETSGEGGPTADGFLRRLLSFAGRTKARSEGIDACLFALRDRLSTRMNMLAEEAGKQDRRQEPLVNLYHRINRKATEARTLGLDLRTFRTNLAEEVTQLTGATAAIGAARLRDAALPQEQIDLDMQTVQPQLETARAFLESDLGEHMGVLTLFVVPLAMMQVVLAILQICWTVASDTETQSWLHPVWDAFAHVTPAVAIVIVGACLPGVWYSLQFARKQNNMRKLGHLAILFAVLVFLGPLAAAIAFLLKWVMTTL